MGRTDGGASTRLAHPYLQEIPQTFRFLISGGISNTLFLTVYNVIVAALEDVVAVATVYAVVYMSFIPVNHAINSMIVFGWPLQYWPSLLSNAPIGLSAMVVGSTLTAYLDRIGFHQQVEDFLEANFVEWWIKTAEEEEEEEEEKGEFYSSLLVMTVTGLWSFSLSLLINRPAAAQGKKNQ